jgi:hypothetical protein
MKTILSSLLVTILTVAEASWPRTLSAQQRLETPKRPDPKAALTETERSPKRDRILPRRKLADGRKVLANELKVTLKESSARELSFDAAGKSRAVDHAVLRALHPDIAAIEGRTARTW